MRRPVLADSFRSFDDLARLHTEGVDYAIQVREPRDSGVAVIAPHGGRIEGGTSAAARRIAGDDHGLYLFEGLRVQNDNFDRLHLTSHWFDEPRCLALISGCDTVIAVHGYAAPGPDVLLGGRDLQLREALARSLAAQGLEVATDGHAYPGTDPRNVCNRGRSGQGVQLELSAKLRRAHAWDAVATAVRAVI